MAPLVALRSWSLRRLARPQPAQTFVPQIDGLRFIAIVSVILYHMQDYVAHKASISSNFSPLQALMAQGHFGVPLFFAVSGYIISLPFLGPNPPRLGRYFLRRLTRLEPPYIISMLCIFGLKLWWLDRSFPELWPHLLASLVYLHGPLFGAHSEVNGVAWSLEVEWQFYLVAPLLLLALLRTSPTWRLLVLVLLIAAGGLAHVHTRGWDARLSLSLLQYFGFFSAGVGVAMLDGRWRATNWAPLFDLSGFAALMAIVLVLVDAHTFRATLPLLTAAFMLSSLRGNWLRALLGWWPLHCIGAMCYSIYLYHFFVISACARAINSILGWPADPDLRLLLLMLVGLPTVLLVCVVPYLLIERPFMIWRPGSNRLRDVLRGRVSERHGEPPVLGRAT